MRYFIGIALPQKVTEELVQVQQQVAGLIDGRLVPRQNMHITLLFLGSLNDEQLAITRQHLKLIPIEPFTLTLGKVEPTKHVIWVTVLSEKLHTLHQAITQQLDIEQKRPYTGHITIGRPKRYYDKQAIKELKVSPLSWQASSFSLYSSQTFQEGPEYKLIKEYSA